MIKFWLIVRPMETQWYLLKVSENEIFGPFRIILINPARVELFGIGTVDIVSDAG